MVISTDTRRCRWGSGTTKTDHVTGQHISIIRGPMDRRRGVWRHGDWVTVTSRGSDHSRKKRRDPESAWNPDGLRRHLRSRRGNRSGDRGIRSGHRRSPTGPAGCRCSSHSARATELDDALVDTIRQSAIGSPAARPRRCRSCPGYLTPPGKKLEVPVTAHRRPPRRLAGPKIGRWSRPYRGGTARTGAASTAGAVHEPRMSIPGWSLSDRRNRLAGWLLILGERRAQADGSRRTAHH